jgi:hypothetical protein
VIKIGVSPLAPILQAYLVGGVIIKRYLTPKLLDRFNYDSKGENSERISKGENNETALKWGLGRMISRSIIHMDLHKLNNKLINA